MLRMPALPAAGLHPAIGGARQSRLREHLRETVSSHSPRSSALSPSEHLAGIGPQGVERVLRAAVAFLGAVAKPDQPLAGVAQMIGGLMPRGGGDAGQC